MRLSLRLVLGPGKDERPFGDPVATVAAAATAATDAGDEERTDDDVFGPLTPTPIMGGVAEPGNEGMGEPAQLRTLPADEVG